MKKKKSVLRIGKQTFGTGDLQELCQKAFEPYFRGEHTVETIHKEIEKQRSTNVKNDDKLSKE